MTDETTASAIIDNPPPFAARLTTEGPRVGIRSLTFAEVKYMNGLAGAIKGEDAESEDKRTDIRGEWLLRFGLVDAKDLGLTLHTEPIETPLGTSKALTRASYKEVAAMPFAQLREILAAIADKTYTGEDELNRLDFTGQSAGGSPARAKGLEIASSAERAEPA